MKLLTYLIFISSLAVYSQDIMQGNIFDLTDVLPDKTGGWAIGNACNVEPYMNAIIRGDLDMKFQKLQIMYSYIIIEGRLLNQGELLYSCDKAVLIVEGRSLDVPDTNEQQAVVYPNPFITEINIRNVEVRTLKLFDVTGRLIKDYVTAGKIHTINVVDLRPGIYFLQINNSITKKLIKL